MRVKLVIHSDVNPEDIKYYISIKSWDQHHISVDLNFTTPLLISKGLQPDEAYMQIINPYLFISDKTGKPI